MTGSLGRIAIFPVKSLDGVTVDEARVRGEAGLARDREYRLTGEDGETLNTKRLGEALVRIRATFDLGFGELTLRHGQDAFHGSLPRDRQTLADWMSGVLSQPVQVEQDAEKGFPDDTEASGPTVISRATLAETGSWFGLSEEEMRRRVRANLEIVGVPAFWEDALYGPAGEPRFFQLGEVELEAVNPCARCAVPSRDSYSGVIPEPRFAKIFAERRRATLPAWAERSRFDHFFRLAVNTRIPASENGKTVQLGDEVHV